MIKIEDVSFRYAGESKGGNGIKNINLTIKKGEFVVLCGKSGCGKTTLTRVINGLIPHFYEGEMDGCAYIDGANVTGQPLSDISTLVGSVFQNPKSQFFHVDTTGELLFGCENHNMSKELMEERLNETADVLKIKPLLNRNIFELSGGEKQQIACGSVYASDPEVFVMDEPTSNLDRKAINRLHQILSKLKSEGKTIVVSEHRLYFLTELPYGIDTVIGEGGASLSGGEAQRISIARCILKDSPIVILDEATASVDADNEAYIQEAIDELCLGKTLLVIAHRLNTIKNADAVFKVENKTVA